MDHPLFDGAPLAYPTKYVFPAIENQPLLPEDIQTLFAPEPCVRRLSPATHDFRTMEKTNCINTGKVTQQVVYGTTRLAAREARAPRLLEIPRGHWGIESRLHYRREVTLREDRSRVRTGQAPRVLAVISNVVLGLFASLGLTSVPEARRHFAAHLDEAANLIMQV